MWAFLVKPHYFYRNNFSKQSQLTNFGFLPFIIKQRQRITFVPSRHVVCDLPPRVAAARQVQRCAVPGTAAAAHASCSAPLPPSPLSEPVPSSCRQAPRGRASLRCWSQTATTQDKQSDKTTYFHFFAVCSHITMAWFNAGVARV